MPNGCRNSRHHVAENEANEDITADSEPSLKEDAKIEEKNGCFREVDRYLVEYLCNVKQLVSVSRVWGQLSEIALPLKP